MKLRIVLCQLIFLIVPLAQHEILGATPRTADESTRKVAEKTLLNLPLHFEQNAGNFDAHVKYLARGPGYTLFLTPGESVLTVQCEKQKRDKRGRAKGASVSTARNAVLRVRPVNGNDSAALRGENRLNTPTNYLIGNDPAKWCTASNYERVRVESVYPGIDIFYYGQMRGLEYDFEVAPGADPKRIAMRYDGVSRLRVGADGTLISQLKGGGEFRQNRPVSYQMIHGQRREVASRYVVRGKRTVAFELDNYDTSQPLVIDPPVISYSTYVGGSQVDDGFGIAVDSNGLIYVAGLTASSNFPTVNQYQTDQTSNDIIILKIDPLLSGTAALLYSTYVGGSGQDFGRAIAVDAAGNVVVTGDTTSTDFPMLNQYQGDQPGTDAFVVKLNTNASGAASLVYSTYLGGSGEDFGTGIALGGAGNAFVTGRTASTDFPTLNQYQSNQPGTDVFITKLNPSLSGAASLLYSTYLGGNDEDLGTAIAVTAGGVAFVTGETASSNFPTRNQYQLDQPGTDVFVSKIDTGVSGVPGLLYSTYLGGGDLERGEGIAIDAGKVYVCGQTASSDFPTLNQYQSHQASSDAFVTVLDSNATGVPSLLYSTYLGGTGFEIANAIAVTPGSGNAVVTGYTASSDFPTANPLQTDQPGNDVFVAKVNSNASGTPSLVFSTYLGGDGDDQGRGVAVSSGDIYVTGRTQSTNFPTLNPFHAAQGSVDVFVTRYAVGLELVSAVSRKTHGGVDYGINLPLSGEPGVECRSGGVGGAHTIIFTFTNTVTSLSASITSGAGDISSPPAVSGNTVTISLGSVVDVQKLRINLSNVMGSGGGSIPSADLDINFLLGDTSGNKSVNATDVTQTKLQSGAVVTAANFRSDINLSGSINATDIGAVKLSSGHGVP